MLRRKIPHSLPPDRMPNKRQRDISDDQVLKEGGPKVSVLRLPWWSVNSSGPVVGVELVPQLLLQNSPQHRYSARWYRLLASSDDGGREDVGRELHYTPCPADIGSELLVECVVLMADGRPLPATRRSARSAVVKAGTVLPPPDRRVASLVSLSHGVSLLHVLSYNILAPILANARTFPYVPPWALDWKYRQELLYAELAMLAEGADVICLQEVPI